MANAIWAVARIALVPGLLFLGSAGCASMPAATSGSGSGPAAPEKRADLNYSPTAAEETPVALSGPGYRIGPEDVLHVSVWDNKELTLDVMVRPDGKISLPLVQDVQAEGLTVAELTGRIHGKLSEFLQEPQVSVIVTQVNAPKIYVLGSVVRPGPYPLRSDMSVLQALSLAGGFTEFASIKKIKIVRNNGTSQETRTVNYYDLLDEGAGNSLLRPGDTIVVP